MIRGVMQIVPCSDCGTTDMPLDAVLTGEQWRMICPEVGAVLCASCIVRRANRLPGIMNVCMRFQFSEDFDDDEVGGRFWQMMKKLDTC